MKNQILIKVVKTKIRLDLFCFFKLNQKVIHRNRILDT